MSIMSVTLPDELLLLAIDDAAGTVRLAQPALDYALAGAQLLELALADRIDVVDKRVNMVDPTQVGDPDLDLALRRIGDAKRRRRPESWVPSLGKGLRGTYLTRLTRWGLVGQETHRILGIFPTRRFPAIDSTVKGETRNRLRAALLEGADPGPRTVALISLLIATDLIKKLFPDADRRAVKRRAKQVSEGEWAGKAVRKAVEAVNAAVIASTASAASG